MTTLTEPAFLNEEEVVQRYRGVLSAATLRNWRSKGMGPPYLRIGKAVLYARDDLERWEATHRRNSPSASG